MSVVTNDAANGGGGSGTPGPPGPSFVSKSGTVSAVSFAGTPKKYSVVFSAAYADALYAVVLSGIESRNFRYESKTAAGFTINTNADTAPASEVSWITIPEGETS